MSASSRLQQRWLLPGAALTVAAVGAGTAAVTAGADTGLTLLGGAAGGAAALAGGLLITLARERRAAERALTDALAERNRAGHVLPRPVTPPNRPPRPSWLLSPDNRVAPFRGRRAELEALSAWLAKADGPTLLVLLGSSGVGKTRLIVEFADMQSGHWVVLRVRGGREAGLIDAVLACATPTILVVDHSQPRDGLAALITDAGRAGGQVRVLLECRSDAWLAALRPDFDEGDMGLLDEAAMLHLAAHGGTEDRLRWLEESVSAVRLLSGLPALTPPVPRLSAPGTALVALQGQAVSLALSSEVEYQDQPSLATVARHLLDHEQRGWRPAAGPPAADDGQIWRRAVGLLTVLGAADERDASQVLRRVPDLEDATEERRRQIARAVRDLYPGAVPGLWVGIPTPDLLAHALFAEVFSTQPMSERLVTPEPAEWQMQHALASLTSGIPHFPVLESVVAAVLASSPLRVLPQVATLAAYLDDPAPADRILAEHIDLTRPALEELTRIESLLPPRLLRVRVVIARHKVRSAEERADDAALGTALQDLHKALGQLGHPREALSVAETAVVVHRRLASRGENKHRRALAMALNHVGLLLLSNKRSDEAVDAHDEGVQILRDLYGEDSAHLLDLVLGLHNLGMALREAGRPKEAIGALEECLVYYRMAAELSATYRAHLALTAASTGLTYSSLGRYEEALAAHEEALTLYRELAISDVQGKLESLASEHHNRGVALAALGRRSDAAAAFEEAVRLYRQIVANNVDADRYGLALALQCLPWELGTDRSTEALAAAEESLGLFRQMVADDGRRSISELVAALQSYGMTLARNDRHGDAINAMEEAIDLCRRLTAENYRQHAPALASALHNLGNMLGQLRRFDEASVAAEEALELLRPLTAEDPDVHLYQFLLAQTLLAESALHRERYDFALQAYEEAARLLNQGRQFIPPQYIYLHDVAASRLRQLRELSDATDDGRNVPPLPEPQA